MVAVIVFLIESSVVDLFAIELARESRISLFAVFYRLSLHFLAATCAASTLYWLVRVFATPPLSLALTTAAAIATTLAILPLLPPRNATAGLFTLERIPEEESAQGKVEQACRLIVESCGLTPRESEVLAALLQGQDRDEVARQLAISSWTVKNHMRGIYSKTNTHSVQELMALVYAGKDSR